MSIEVNPWINSGRKRVVEIGVLTAASPAIGATALLAAGALKLTDGSEKLIHEVERSLLPDKIYGMRKLGNPRSGSRAATALRKAMIDEIPQTAAIFSGEMSLFGPRGANPEHVNKSFESVARQDPQLHVSALAAHERQKAGWISSYAILSHSNNLAALEEDVRFPGGTTLDANALVRLSLDVKDYKNDGFKYEMNMLAHCVDMVKGNYAYYVGEALRT